MNRVKYIPLYEMSGIQLFALDKNIRGARPELWKIFPNINAVKKYARGQLWDDKTFEADRNEYELYFSDGRMDYFIYK